MIYGSRWERTQDMTKVGSSETKLAVLNFGSHAQWDGADMIGADRKFSYNDGLRLRIYGASTLVGSGTVKISVYRGNDGAAGTLVGTTPAYTVAQLKEFEKNAEYIRFPLTSEGGTCFQLGITSSAEAGTAFTAGTLGIIVEID